MNTESKFLAVYALMAANLIVLKGVGILGWSWWGATAPIWGPIALVAAVMLFVLILAWVDIFVCEIWDIFKRPK